MSLLGFIKRILHSSARDDSEFIEPEEIKKIGNVIAAPALTTPPDENSKETKQ